MCQCGRSPKYGHDKFLASDSAAVGGIEPDHTSKSKNGVQLFFLQGNFMNAEVLEPSL
jgi:hypothetical protein